MKKPGEPGFFTNKQCRYLLGSVLLAINDVLIDHIHEVIDFILQIKIFRFG